MLGGAQMEPSHFCSKSQVPLPFSPHVPFSLQAPAWISPCGPLFVVPLLFDPVVAAPLC